MRKFLTFMLGAIVALGSLHLTSMPAVAAAPTAPLSVGAMLANTYLYAGIEMPNTGTPGTGFTIEALTTNSLTDPAIASCSGSINPGARYAPIPRCSITGLSNSTNYYLRAYITNTDGNSAAVMSSYSYRPTASPKIIRAEVPCDTVGWGVMPCSSSTGDTLIKVYGQGLQTCTALTATGGNSPSTPIAVTPNLAGTEMTFVKPSAPYGWASFDCVGNVSNFFMSGISLFTNASLVYSTTNVAPGDQINIKSTYQMFIGVTGLTIGGIAASYTVIDYHNIVVTIPNGLTSGAKSVVLNNISGAGTKAAALSVTVSVTAPGTPGTPTAVAGDASATVTVVAPSTGGAVATYAVTATPGGATCTVTVPATSCVITGLTNGTSYTFAATATNTAATSVSSVSSAAVTPATVPGAPTIDAITAGDQQVSVAFTAPVSNGGGLITNYKYSTDNGATWVSAGSTASPIVVTGLTNGTDYNVKLRAVNSAGDGTASAAVTGTPVAPPAPAPSNPAPPAPVVPDVPAAPPASVESVKVVQAPGKKGSVLKVAISPQPSGAAPGTIVVKILNLRGQVIQELKVPINSDASAIELPINLPLGEFTVEAQTLNSTSSAPVVATQPTFVPMSFFEVSKTSEEPVLAGKKVSSPIIFTPNSSELTAVAKKELLKIAKTVSKSNSRVALTGFTASANAGKTVEQKLATARAKQVAKFLKAQGVDKWIYFAGFGALSPNTPATQARKVELRLIK